jgi:hypothetical protein
MKKKRFAELVESIREAGKSIVASSRSTTSQLRPCAPESGLRAIRTPHRRG